MISAAEIYIGLMSGTSVDSIDAAAMTFNDGQLQLIGTYSQPIPAILKRNIIDLCQPGRDSVQLYCQTDSQLGELFAKAVVALMSAESIAPDQVAAVCLDKGDLAQVSIRRDEQPVRGAAVVKVAVDRDDPPVTERDDKVIFDPLLVLQVNLSQI
mgnify:CR=1 FL=1